MSRPGLRGPRVLLRSWRTTDLDGLSDLLADPRTVEFLLGPPDRDTVQHLMAQWQAQIDGHGFGFWAMELPGTQRFIGFAGLTPVTFDAHFTPAIELGWMIDSRHWGMGYATEAAGLAVRHGFGHLGLTELVAMAAPGNLRSRRVMEKLGMTRRDEDDFDIPLLAEGHPLRRQVLYRLRREDACQERHYMPRYALRTSSDAASSSDLPDKATRPLCIT